MEENRVTVLKSLQPSSVFIHTHTYHQIVWVLQQKSPWSISCRQLIACNYAQIKVSTRERSWGKILLLCWSPCLGWVEKRSWAFSVISELLRCIKLPPTTALKELVDLTPSVGIIYVHSLVAPPHHKKVLKGQFWLWLILWKMSV